MSEQSAAYSVRIMRTIHTLLSVQTIVIILGSINRLTNLTTAYVLPNQFLRWVDLLNMLVIPLASLLASYLLKRHLETAHNSGARDGRAHIWLSIKTKTSFGKQNNFAL